MSLRNCHGTARRGQTYPIQYWAEAGTRVGDTITWNQWSNSSNETYTLPITLFPYASGSDYSGGTVEQSNYRVLCEDPHVIRRSVTIQGGHGTFGIAYIGQPTRPIKDILASLDGYPLLDEDDHSELETEQELEAWKDWGRKEFTSELLDRVNQELPDESQIEELNLGESQIDSLWRDLAQDHGDGGRMFEDGGGCHFYISECIERYLTVEHMETLGLVPRPMGDVFVVHLEIIMGLLRSPEYLAILFSNLGIT